MPSEFDLTQSQLYFAPDDTATTGGNHDNNRRNVHEQLEQILHPYVQVIQNNETMNAHDMYEAIEEILRLHTSIETQQQTTDNIQHKHGTYTAKQAYDQWDTNHIPAVSYMLNQAERCFDAEDETHWTLYGTMAKIIILAAPLFADDTIKMKEKTYWENLKPDSEHYAFAIFVRHIIDINDERVVLSEEQSENGNNEQEDISRVYKDLSDQTDQALFTLFLPEFPLN